jgi:prevent-host-death family protein
MPKETYSTYDAKARFSELLRKVRNNRRIIITHRGMPVAELGPVKSNDSLPEQIAEAENAGIITPAGSASAPTEPLQPIVRKPGVLRRFLEERD